MKKTTFGLVLLVLVFASSSQATIYKWVDERGVVNFTDDSGKVPPRYLDGAEKIVVPLRGPAGPSAGAGGQAGNPGTRLPPIAQALVREGDFAARLAEALKTGPVKGEAEAESLLSAVGVAPRTGWIADYPVTPDIVEELRKAVGDAASSGRLPMGRDEATEVFGTLVAQQGLSVTGADDGRDGRVDSTAQAPEPGVEDEGREGLSESSRGQGDYPSPVVINNYYDEQGPPVVTYYPPPPEYVYLYAWVSYPFRCSRFRFPGYFVLHDFHRVPGGNGRRRVISNHITDPATGRTVSVDPVTRAAGGPRPVFADRAPGRGFSSPAAERSAGSIYRRHDRTRPGNPGPTVTGRVSARPAPARGNEPSPSYGAPSSSPRPPSAVHRMRGNPAGIVSHGLEGRVTGPQSRLDNPREMPSGEGSAAPSRTRAPAKAGAPIGFGGAPGNGGTPGPAMPRHQ